MSGAARLQQLANAARVDDPVAIVAAHPDDEMLGLGSRIGRFARLTLIHVTDGSPHDRGDAQRAGLDTREAYVALRRRELGAALDAAGAAPERVLVYDIADQDAVRRLPELIDRLTADLAGMAAVATHPYEGGHPDHDAAALSVQAACARLGDAAPVRLEFAGYHQTSAGPRTGVFWGDEGLVCAADEGDRARRAAALAAYASQASVLSNFDVAAPERLRLAPIYDFRAAPPPDRVMYDRYGWAMTSALWRETAAKARPWG